MTFSFTLVLAALLVLLLLLRAAKGYRAVAKDPETLAGSICTVDLEAFRNLTDPEEEEFLRLRLRPKDFRSIQRKRLHAAAEYVHCVAKNAALLVALGEAARNSSDPTVAAAGKEVVDSALRLRLYALLVLIKLSIGIAMPGAIARPTGIADRYQRMRALVANLCRLQYAARGARIAASL